MSQTQKEALPSLLDNSLQELVDNTLAAVAGMDRTGLEVDRVVRIDLVVVDFRSMDRSLGQHHNGYIEKYMGQQVPQAKSCHRLDARLRWVARWWTARSFV